MKKLISILLVLTMVLSLAACGSKGGNDVEEEAKTIGQKLFVDFKSKVGDAASAEDLANELITNEIIPFFGATMPVEPGYLNGFTDEITGFSEGATFGPMIGAIPFVGYVFKLDDGADVNAFMDTLKEKADLRWNICTAADEMYCNNVDNTVFFVMCPAEFEEEE